MTPQVIGSQPAQPSSRVDSVFRWLLPSWADLIFLTAIYGCVAHGARMISSDGDAARHLTLGEYILSSGQIPHQDLFSYTMGGQPFVPFEWLAEVLSAISYRWDGLAGPPLLFGAVIGLTFVVLFRHILQRGQGALVAAAVTFLALITSSIHWLARPHIFTFLGTAMFAALLDACSLAESAPVACGSSRPSWCCGQICMADF